MMSGIFLGRNDRKSKQEAEAALNELNEKILGIPSCDSGCLHGIHVFSDGGFVQTELCSCVDHLPDQIKTELNNRREMIQNSGMPPVFANRLYGGCSFEDVAPAELQQWSDDICQSKGEGGNHIFLCGNVGTGKTHLASDCIKRFVVRAGRPASYATATVVVEVKNNALASRNYGRRPEENEERKYRETLLNTVKHVGFLAIDELREAKPTDVAILEELIDKRYQNGLATMLISNHTFNAKTSYKGKTIQRVLGNRTADRLKSMVTCEFNGRSRRGVRHPDEISQREQDNFCFPSSILALGQGMFQMLNAIVRSLLFEAIHRKDRKIVKNDLGQPSYRDGVPVDAPREKSTVVDNVWYKEDDLILSGPILCRQDLLTYAASLYVLKERHCMRNLGLNISVVPSHLMRILGLSLTSRTSREALHRSLARLSSTTLDYRDRIGRRWVGPLLYFQFQPNNRDGVFSINFNKSMIDFYNACEYTVIHKKILTAKIGTDGIRTHMLLRSHTGNSLIIGVTGLLKFLGKPVEKMDDTPAGRALMRKHSKKLSKNLRIQIKEELLTEDSGIKRDGNVVLKAVPLDTTALN